VLRVPDLAVAVRVTAGPPRQSPELRVAPPVPMLPKMDPDFTFSTSDLEYIERHRAWMTEHGELDRRRSNRLRDEVRSHALARFGLAVDERLNSDRGRALLDEVTQRRLTPAAAARTLLATD